MCQYHYMHQLRMHTSSSTSYRHVVQVAGEMQNRTLGYTCIIDLAYSRICFTRSGYLRRSRKLPRPSSSVGPVLGATDAAALQLRSCGATSSSNIIVIRNNTNDQQHTHTATRPTQTIPPQPIQHTSTTNSHTRAHTTATTTTHSHTQQQQQRP